MSMNKKDSGHEYGIARYACLKNSFSHVLHRGSDISAPLFADNDDLLYMSVHVLLNVLNELRKSNKNAKLFYCFSATSLIKSIRQEPKC